MGRVDIPGRIDPRSSERVKAYAFLTAESPEEAVDVFLRREDAEAALANCLRDELKWRGVVSVVPIELDERDVSAN